MAEQQRGLVPAEPDKNPVAVAVTVANTLPDMMPSNVVEIYKAYLDDSHQLRTERQAVNAVHVTIVTLFLGAEGYVANQGLIGAPVKDIASIALPEWLPIIVSIFVGVAGFLFCRNWQRLNNDYGNNLKVKYAQITHMEQDFAAQLAPIGATLFINEDRERKKGTGVRIRTQKLQDFFYWVFVILIIGAPLAKIAAALTYGPVTIGALHIP